MRTLDTILTLRTQFLCLSLQSTFPFVLYPPYLLVPQNVFSPGIFSFSPSLRLTSLEEELMDMARTMGSQQTSLEQLELELEAEQEGVKKGQR